MALAVSLNGWPVIFTGTDSRLKTGTIPGTKRTLTMRADVLPLFLHFCAAWNTEMPDRLKLTDPRNEVDGWEPRQSRTGAGFSDHASGTACDLAYRILLADHQLHFSPTERDTLTRILGRYTTGDGHHVLANGYMWTPGKFADEMHTELSQGWDVKNGAKRNTTAADVRNVIDRLGIRPDGTVAAPKLYAQVTGHTPVTASDCARCLGISRARFLWFNPSLALRRAQPGSQVRVPPGVTPVPVHAGP